MGRVEQEPVPEKEQVPEKEPVPVLEPALEQEAVRSASELPYANRMALSG